jgi:RimJ/RimL family protein N-acetyltransferase
LQTGPKPFLGDYAATNPTEFFSVASEKFFSLPQQLRQAHPDLFEVLAEYYRVDPLMWFEGKPGADLVGAPSSVAKGPATDEAEATAALELSESSFTDFNCPYCQTLLSFPKTEAGTLRQCPNCLDSMIVPNRAGTPAERIIFPIRTERLVLRRFQTLDAKDLADLLSNPDILRYIDWKPMTLDDAEEWIARQSGFRFPHPNEYCHFIIEAIPAGKVVGLVTFWFLHDEFDLAQFEVLIHPDVQRKGYAAEAIRGLLTYVFSGLRVRRIIAECDARNGSARGLLLKAGFRQESECIKDRLQKGQWVNTVGFAMLREEYKSLG